MDVDINTGCWGLMGNLGLMGTLGTDGNSGCSSRDMICCVWTVLGSWDFCWELENGGLAEAKKALLSPHGAAWDLPNG